MATQQLNTLDAVTRTIEGSGIPKGPKRGGFYCPEGQCYFVFLEETLNYAQRVDEHFTVFKATDDDRLVGFQVKCTNLETPHELQYRVGRSVPDPTAPIDAVELVVRALRASSDLQGGRLPRERDLSHYLSAVSALGREDVPVRRRELANAY